MKKLFSRLALLCIFMCHASLAWGAAPQEALSAKPEQSVYAVLNVGDIGQRLRDIFSPAVLELFSPLMSQEIRGGLGMISGFLATLPAGEMALVSGTDSNLNPFFQIAAAMPEELQPKLDLLASGKASPSDMVSLLIGCSGQLFAEMLRPYLTYTGSFYTFGGHGAMTAKDNLLLLSLTSADLEAGISSLSNAEERLNLKRRYSGRDFLVFHIDIPSLAAIAKSQKSGEFDLKAAEALFKKPIRLEYDFQSMPNLFRIAAAFDMDALSDAALKFFKIFSPVENGDFFMTGSGKPLMAMFGRLSFKASDLAPYPEAVKLWGKGIKRLGRMGITEADVENLISGPMSLVIGGSFSVMGQKIPGAYFAVKGRDGAALKVLDKVLEYEPFSKSVPFAPLKVKGWQKAVKIDPAITCVQLLLGVKDEVLFLGVQDPESLGSDPEISPRLKEFLDKKFFSAFFIDVEGVWDIFSREIKKPSPVMSIPLAFIPSPVLTAMGSIFDGRPSIPFVSAYVPETGSVFADFAIQEDSQDQQILTRLIKVLAEVKQATETKDKSDKLSK